MSVEIDARNTGQDPWNTYAELPGDLPSLCLALRWVVAPLSVEEVRKKILWFREPAAGAIVEFSPREQFHPYIAAWRRFILSKLKLPPYRHMRDRFLSQMSECTHSCSECMASRCNHKPYQWLRNYHKSYLLWRKLVLFRYTLGKWPSSISWD